MATSRGKTSPDVALLIKRVEMDPRFRVEVKDGSNKVNVTGPDGQPLIISLNADPTDMRRAERALERMGLRDGSPASQAPRVTESVTVRKTSENTDPYPNQTVFEKAKKVWKGARDYAAAKNKSLMEVDGVEFYMIDDKPLAYFVARHYPKIQHYAGPGGKQEIYDFLRSTGNYARERDEDENSIFIVRTEWSDSGLAVVVRNPRKAVSDYERNKQRQEAKIREQEVSQALRAPQDDLVVMKIEPKSKPTPADIPSIDSEAAAALKREQERIASLTCPECKAEDKEFVAKNPQGLAGHRKAQHNVQGTTYKPSVVGKIDPDSPLAEIGMAFDMLRDALTRATGLVVHENCEQRISEAEHEAAFQKADAQVQRERAERAEQTLACIRIAFDTLPVNKAVAETLDLIPPVTE
jgi:hypothetical protein